MKYFSMIHISFNLKSQQLNSSVAKRVFQSRMSHCLQLIRVLAVRILYHNALMHESSCTMSSATCLN